MVYFYVYALVDGNNPFYIGMSCYPTMRFQQHCTGSGTNETAIYIYEMRLAGAMPTMKILGHSYGRWDAVQMEECIIKAFTAIGTKLINNERHEQTIYQRHAARPKLPRLKQGYANYIRDELLKEYHNEK